MSKRPTQQLLAFFKYEHLRSEEMKSVSKLFHDLAHELEAKLPDGPEKTVGLRKVLEAKDCAVRAVLAHEEEQAAKAPKVVEPPPAA